MVIVVVAALAASSPLRATRSCSSFICTFDAIFELAPIVGELFGHFVNPAWHIATDCGPEDHALTDMEFMRHYGAPSRMGVSVARPLSVSVTRRSHDCAR